MKKKLAGILTLISVLITVVVGVLTFLSDEFFSASNVKLLIVLFVLSIVLSGIYLLNAFCPATNHGTKLMLTLFGLGIVGFSALVSYNITDFLSAYNWLIAGGLLYVLLVQLQLLQWTKAQSFLAKFLGIVLIVSSLSLIVFFISGWKYSGLAFWIDIVTLTAIGSFIVGLFLVPRPKKEVSQTQE